MAQTKRRRRLSPRVRKWSAEVTRRSDAMDIPKGVFRSDDPGAIARALKRSAERSKRRKSSPFRSALSLLTFYINRAGTNLGTRRRAVLQRAKQRLRELYGR
jgi:uncharacterized protein DUF3175